MKKILLLACCSFFALQLSAQNEHCGSTEATEALLKKYPELLPTIKKNEERFWEGLKKADTKRMSSGPVYIIPIVFHVIHNYGTENISDAQIINEVAILNRDYRKQNPDTAVIIPEFKNLVADIEVEFRLAQKDPQGNCSTGIDRIPSLKTNQADDNSKLNQWDPKRYLNVWVVKTIGAQGVAGYAYFPSTAEAMPEIDGVLILSNYIGSIGSSDPSLSRALTHEIGHYLSLPHVWGGTNTPGVACGDDGIGDTPVTKGWKYCPQASSATSCGTVKENYQNYMEYSYCTAMFTNGQKNSMRYAMITSPARYDLWTAQNLAATGTDGTPAVTCAPNPDFITSSFITAACENSNLTFSDKTWGNAATALEWTFDGADQPTSTVKNPVVHYSQPGVFDVSLKATNSAGSKTLSRKAYVTIVPKLAFYGMPFTDPYTSDFKGVGWYPLLQQADTVTKWKTTPNGYSGSAIMINNYDINATGAYAIVSPRLDFSKTKQATLQFKMAYAVKTSQSNDVVKIYYSLDCGTSWTSFATYIMKNININGLYGDPFTPTKPSHWLPETINIPTAVEGKTPVLFKIELNKGGGGNNLYIDEFQIAGVTGIEEALDNISLSIFPNPTEGSSTLSFDLPKSELVTIRVFDIVGKEVKTILNEKRLNSGLNTFDLSIPVKGIYMVKIKVDNTEVTKKIVIN